MKRTISSLLLFCFGMFFSSNAFAADKEGVVYMPRYPGHLFHVDNNGNVRDSLGQFRIDTKPLGFVDADQRICTNTTVAYDQSLYNKWYCTTDYVLTQRIFDFSAGIFLPVVINGRTFTDVLTDAAYGSDAAKAAFGWKHLRLFFYNRADNPNITTSAILGHSNNLYPRDQHYVHMYSTQILNCINRTNMSETDNSLANCETEVYNASFARTTYIENVGIVNAKTSQDMYYNGSLYFAANVTPGISSMHQLTVTINNPAGGTVTSYPDCLTCTDNVCQGSCAGTVTLTERPTDGWLFDKWSDETMCYYNNTITVDMTGDRNVELDFKGIRYPVDYSLTNPNGWSQAIQSFASLNYNGKPHMGEDWNKSNDRGQQLYAIANGVVEDITPGNGLVDGWGKTILIRHDAPEGYQFLTGTGQKLSTVYSLYAHMLKSGQANYVASKDIHYVKGQSISLNETVGQVGDGDGKWPVHLHFGIITETDSVWLADYRNKGAYDWDLLSHYTDPSELISNGFYSDESVEFSIVVHPYECGGTFRLDGSSPDPNCMDNSSPATVGNWTKQGGNYSDYYQLGYNGIIYSKDASIAGTASWHPNLPKDGQYKVSVYIPKNNPNHPYYATSAGAVYTVSGNGTCYTPQSIDQSAVTDADRWVDIGTYDLYQYGSPTVSLQGDTDEESKSIAVDAVKFEYVGPIQQ